jgi:hypothetical protein
LFENFREYSLKQDLLNYTTDNPSLFSLVNIFLSKDNLQSVCAAVQYQLVREDPFAEMATSFQTRQAAACDGEVLNLNCPSGTKVWFGFFNP